MNAQERIDYLNAVLPAFETAWPRIAAELEARLADKTNALIAEDNEQTRGAIKELRALLELPATLQSERDQINAALSDEDAAH